jgi:hypothetical protein
MTELRIGADLESQVAARHHAAAEELSALPGSPTLGPGPGTLAMLKVFAAVLQCSDALAATNALTADAVRRVAHTLRETDAEIGRRLEHATPDLGPVVP